MITLAHGSGGKYSHDLIEEVFLPAFGQSGLVSQHDGAQFEVSAGRIAFTTDSFVVSPQFFPGGNIGKLAVCGTVNDIAMNGAVPKYLSAAFILEEGLPLKTLKAVVQSMKEAAEEADVQIVTGDTKVVNKGAVDGLYINTTGIGFIPPHIEINPAKATVGYDILISGTLGDHAIAVMKERHGLALPESLVSDCAPLNHIVKKLLAHIPEINVLRDPTRGGVATTLNEIAQQSQIGIELSEELLPVRPEVKGVCDLLGYDPLYLANEGKFLAFVPEEKTSEALAILRSESYSKEAAKIGRVTLDHPGQVAVETLLGGKRLADMLISDQLPRIC